MTARQSQPHASYSKANTQEGATEWLRTSPPGLTSLLQGQSQEGKGKLPPTPSTPKRLVCSLLKY